MKKVILLFTYVLLITFFLTAKVEATAPSLSTCRIDGKVLAIKGEYVEFMVSHVVIYEKRFVPCTNIKDGEKYQLKINNNTRNIYNLKDFVGKDLVIDGSTKSSLADNNPIWMLLSVGNITANNEYFIDSIEKLEVDTIEEVVRASGGTYGVIDTSDPNAASNHVQTILNQGLTNSDGNGDCWSMNIKPGVKISCGLSVNEDAYYYYEGKRGEKVTITVLAKNFVPEIDISDANGAMEFFDNKQKQNFLTITKTLSYTGKYTFEVKTRYHTETKEGEPFTINLTSDKSNIQPDIRKDNLVAGRKYTIKELNSNQSKIPRTFIVDAYVISIYKNPSCPSEAYSCPKSLPPNISIWDVNPTFSTPLDLSAKLWTGDGSKYNFEIGNRYKFNVSVVNTSNTNIPNNNFSLISVKNLDGTLVSTGTSTTDVVDQKTFVYTKMWKWFRSLFK